MVCDLHVFLVDDVAVRNAIWLLLIAGVAVRIALSSFRFSLSKTKEEPDVG